MILKNSNNVRTHIYRVVAFPLVLMCGTIGVGTLAGCAGGAASTSLLLQIVLVVVTRAAGGTVVNHNASLLIPPNSLGSDTTISVQPATDLPDVGAGRVLVPNTAFTYGPTGTTFSPSATLTINYDPGTVPNTTEAQNFVLYKLTGSTYTVVTASAVDIVAHTVTAPISQVETYVVLGIVPIIDPR